MPRQYNVRSLNIKIVKIRNIVRTRNNRCDVCYDVYNMHNANIHQFNSLRRMFSYYSPNTKFINYDTGEELERDVIHLRTTGRIIVYRRDYQYRTLSGRDLFDTDNLSNVYCIPYYGSITQIRERIERGDVSISHIANQERQTQEQINENLVYSYHGGPQDIHMLKHPTDNSAEKRYFGIELEMDASRDAGASSRKKNLLATRLNTLLNEGDYNSLVKFETDGSIGAYGIEMITQPMTMKYIMNNKDKFKEAMQIIDNLNYSSHDSGRCGMHIHVSRNALNEDIIDNLYLIFENFKNEIVAFSRRNENQMTWCRFMCDNSSRDIMTEDYIKNNKPCGNDHHSAINNGNRATVEFRIFRGTTKLRTFLANIQLIDNMITLAKRDNVEGITWDEIINLKEEYIELKQYNEKRAIISKHILTKNISRMEVIQRPVILVRPFQMRLEGDN